LLESLIALVIVSFGMMAVSTQINRYVVGATYMEEKTLASWIATNKLTELSVAPTWPQVGDYDEDVSSGREGVASSGSETDVENCIASTCRSGCSAIPHDRWS
jgi:type II secretion system protein I